jgi:hypothetical protein
MLFRISQVGAVHLPKGDGIGVIVHRRESNHTICCDDNVKSEGPAFGWIDRKLTKSTQRRGYLDADRRPTPLVQLQR